MDSDSSDSDKKYLSSESDNENILYDYLSSESDDKYIPNDAKIYKKIIGWQIAGDINSNLNNPELNTYPDHWLIFTAIMLLMSYVVFSIRTKGFS